MNPLVIVALMAVWTLALVEGLVIVVLMREIGRIHLRLGPPLGARATDDGPEVGELMPDAVVRDQEGQAWSLRAKGERALLLVLLSQDCRACQGVVAGLRAFRSSYPEIDVVVSFSEHRGPLDAGLEGVPCIVDGQVPYLLGVARFPYSLLVHREHVVAKGIVNHLEHLESLVAAVGATAGPVPQAVGGEVGDVG